MLRSVCVEQYCVSRFVAKIGCLRWALWLKVCRNKWDAHVTTVAASDSHGVSNDQKFSGNLISAVTYRRRFLLADLEGLGESGSPLGIDVTSFTRLLGAVFARPYVRMHALARSFAREGSSFCRSYGIELAWLGHAGPSVNLGPTGSIRDSWMDNERYPKPSQHRESFLFPL